MPPKKQKQSGKNAFFYFMQEFRNTQGTNFKNMAEVAAAAGPHWERMPKEQRRPYEEKALLEKNNMKGGKYNSDGVELDKLERAEQYEKHFIEEMKHNINEELKLAGKNGTIQDKMFHLIHINSFCRWASADRYLPAEIAIAAFNLVDGVLKENVFHRMIKPGPLPMGYTGLALTISNETHQIKPPMIDDIENNIKEVFYDMKQFLQRTSQGSDRMPVLYCHEGYSQIVQGILDNWSHDFDDINFQVYKLQYMFRVLKNTVANDNVWSTDTFGTREIEKDVNAYAKGISCEYHEITNVPIHCSRSIVVRYAYTICDNCCSYLGIPFVPGRHVAYDAAVSRSSSSASTRSYKSSTSRLYTSSIRDDDSESVFSISSKSEWDNQSVTSEVSTINDEDHFPSLEKSNKNKNSSPASWMSLPNDSSSLCSVPSNRSYAGATGTSGLSRRPADMPSNVLSRMKKLSVSSSNSSTHSLGRGMAKPSEDDFPILGRGRGRGNRFANN